MNYPLKTAHTGCMSTKPNTLQSIEAGIKHGANIIEVDLRTTKDGIFVLSHDDILHGSNKSSISESTYLELKEECEDLTRLEEALQLINTNKKIINLDIKDVSDFSAMYEIVRTYHSTGATIITGCGVEQAKKVNRICSDINIYLAAEDESLENPILDYDRYIKETCQDAIDSGCAGINIDYKCCRKELVDYAKTKDLPVYVWTIDDKDNMEKFIQMGVASITTNQVALLTSLTP